MHIKTHDKAYIVVLEDGSEWRIWPADIKTTLYWTPDTDLELREVADAFCTHILVDHAHGSCVRVIEADQDWAPQQIEASIVS